MPSGHPGSTYEPRTDTAIRLARWRRLANAGLTSDEIAAEIGMTRDALDQMVVRARRHGHPDAIRHPHAGFQGLRHVIDSRARRTRIHALRSNQGVST